MSFDVNTKPLAELGTEASSAIEHFAVKIALDLPGRPDLVHRTVQLASKLFELVEEARCANDAKGGP